MLKLGSHTQFEGNLTDMIQSCGIPVIQFFMGSPLSVNRSKISEADLKSAKKLVESVHVFSHFPYIANLAGSKEILAWAGDPKMDIKTLKTLTSLTYELKILGELNGGVVIHPGNHKNTENGLKAISESINRIIFPTNSLLLLENTAGGGTSLCRDLKEIKTVLDVVDEAKRDHVGVCIDTCHLFAYGDYDISMTEQVNKFFDDFDESIGLDKLKLLHLNDSCKCLKSRVDRHANIGTGKIWSKNTDSLKCLLLKCISLDIPVCLETTGSDIEVVESIMREIKRD
jgi:deoxyribonuclease-4